MSRTVPAILVVCLAGCHAQAPRSWTSPEAASSTEALAGASAALTVEARFGGVVRDASAERRMERVGERLAGCLPDLNGDYRFRLLDSDELNAVSLPGRRIYVTRALYRLLDGDDLLAAALGHEMAHIESGDHFKVRCSDSNEALDKELSADTRAADHLDACGYRSSALIDLVRLVGDSQPAGWVDARVTTLTLRARAFHKLIAYPSTACNAGLAAHDR